MDLSTAFDSLNHELLIAKLRCHGLDQHAIEFFRSYLSNRYQCCKLNNTLGDWRKIIAVYYRDLHYISGPLLFDIFLNDVFFLKHASLGNYADDSTMYAYNKKWETVISNLKKWSFYII